MIRIRKALLALTAAASIGSLALAVDSSSPAPAAVPDDTPPAAHGRVARMMHHAARRLDLTETQVSALKDIVSLHQPELQPLLQRARDEREALREIVAAPELDEAALEAQAATMAETHRLLTLAGARMRADLRAILTPEQIEKLTELRSAGAERGHRGRKALDAWLDEP